MGLTVKRKYIKTVEVQEGEEYQIPRNQQIITTKVIHQITPENGQPIGWRDRLLFPRYKVVIVLQCVEFEEGEWDKTE